MSAPERFQVGDTVRCVEGHPLLPIGPHTVTAILEDSMIEVDGRGGDGWLNSRFVLVSRPTPSALDPFAWDLEAFREAARWTNSPAWDEDIVAWSRFCYWATSVNLAAHFLPTQPAARTRASNGRDVPAATVLVELPVDVARAYGRHGGGESISTHQFFEVKRACRRALGGGA